jgi:hypothetical protein
MDFISFHTPHYASIERISSLHKTAVVIVKYLKKCFAIVDAVKYYPV